MQYRKFFVSFLMLTTICTSLITGSFTYQIPQKQKSTVGKTQKIFSKTPTVQAETTSLNAPHTSTFPTIDGDIGDTEWSDAQSYTLTFQDRYGETHSQSVTLLCTDTALYIASDCNVSDDWDNNLRLSFDGNNNQEADGTVDPLPHTDTRVQWTAPSGWDGYTKYGVYYTENGEVTRDQARNCDNVTVPDALKRASNAGDQTVFYEFKIPFSVLDVSLGDTIGFFMGQRTGDTGDDYKYVWPSRLAEATNWDAGAFRFWMEMNEWGTLTLGTGEEDTTDLNAPHTSTSPTIDGDIGDTEWSAANQYDLTFANYNITDTHTSTVYFLCTDDALYIATNSKFSDGWDNSFKVFTDGNNNQIADGTFDPQPHSDLRIQYPAPSAWRGYNRYKIAYMKNNEVKTAQASDYNNLTKPSGLERASKAGSDTVYYEFKIPLSAIGLSPGETMGMALGTHTPDHGPMERYFWTQQLADTAGDPDRGKWDIMDTWGTLTLGTGDEDMTDPSVSISSPDSGEIFSTSEVTVEWSGSDNIDIDHYEVQLDSGSWTNVDTATSHTFTGVADGSHTVEVKAVDTSGNTATDSVTFEVQTEQETGTDGGGLSGTAIAGISIGIGIVIAGALIAFVLKRQPS